jgi:glycosyltransferase involved in cell wall biosynthesis
MGMTNAPPADAGITAVICTRDRPDLLRRALASLMRLDPPASELLIVDNAPSDERTATLVAREFRSVRYVREAVPGLDFARNRALVEARFPVIAFIDDDAVADPGWIAAFQSVFRDRPGVGACTGRVEPLEVETESQRLFEANGGFSRGLDPIRLPDDCALPLHGRAAPAIAWAVSIGCGCSLAVRKDAVLAIGGFDDALDLGAVLPGGGDLDILWRLLDAGHGLEYQPDALAWHEHRRDMASVERQIVGHQRALLAFLRKSLRQARPENRWQIAAFLVWRLIKPLVRLCKRAVGRDPLPTALLVRMCWNSWIGGIFAYAAAQKEAKRRISRLTQTGFLADT